MSENNTLAAMGIQNPEEIARFDLYSIDGVDVLRIVYDRKKGSILPVTRKYRFAQIRKSTMVDSGTRKTEVLYESSQQLRSALTELGALMDKRGSVAANVDGLKEEIRLLEEEFAFRIGHIKGMIDRI